MWQIHMMTGREDETVDNAPSDEELTVRAQSGDSAALGLLPS
jgi:hypothetical protein